MVKTGVWYEKNNNQIARAIRGDRSFQEKHRVGMPFFIRADGMISDGTIVKEIEKIKMLNRVAEEELSSV